MPIIKPFIFSINALSGGGKTTTARELQKKLPNAKALYFDDRNYDSDSGIIDIAKWVNDGADVNLWKLERLAEDIEKIKSETPEFIILDYPFGYSHNLISPYLNYTIFIDTPFDIILARRIIGDFDKETMIFKWDNESTVFNYLEHYLEHGRNVYLHGLKTGKTNADLIIDGTLPLDKIVEIIYGKIITLRNVNIVV